MCVGMSFFYGVVDVELMLLLSDDDGVCDVGVCDDVMMMVKDVYCVVWWLMMMMVLLCVVDVMMVLDGDDDEVMWVMVMCGMMVCGMVCVVVDALRETRRDAYYAETAREDGVKDVVMIWVDVCRVMIVE